MTIKLSATPLASAAAIFALSTASAQTPPDERNQVVELSPFTVNTEADAGWVASSSLAGSRLNTPLRDTGASISVLTSEFLNDLGAIDMSEAVAYAVNVHMTETRPDSTNDNYIMELFDVGRLNIRGLPATSTRNYYRWRMQSDSYNVDRIEENRGPNSILFGIGSAGGVLNSVTKRASVSRDFRNGTVMFGSEGTYRGTVDINQRLSDDRLAVRVNAVHSNKETFRLHKYNETSRLHLASTFQARPTTQFRVDFEIGEINQVTARGIPAADGVTEWLAAGSPTFATAQSGPELNANGLSRYGGATRFTYVANSGQSFNVSGTNRSTGTGYVVLDESLVDFSVNPGGPGQKREAELANFTIFWEEQLGEKTFLELSHNRQYADYFATITGQSRSENATMYADPNEFLPDGVTPNPYVGRFFFEGGRMNEIRTDDQSRATRLMLSHEADFGKWGNYRLAGMGEYEWRNEQRNVMVEVWDGSPFNSNPEHTNNQVHRRHYATTGDWSTYYVSGPGLGGLLKDIPHPTEPGRTLDSTWVPFNRGGQRNPIERQRTLLLGLQARYLNNRLVLAGGFRRDLLSVKTVDAVRDPVTNQWTLDSPEIEPLTQKFAGSTRTLGVVGHPTRWLSVFYNYSNSLNLPNTGHRILPDGLPPPLSDAEGQDYGVALTFYDGKLVVRANAFEVDLLNATGGGFGGTFSNPTVLTNDVLNAVVGEGLITQAEADAHTIDTNQSIKNQRLEGYEFNITGALTDNWRVVASYSYTDGYDSQIAPEIKEWAEEAIPYFMQWPDVLTTAEQGGEFLTVAERVALWERNAATEWLREGNKLLGNRKHKFSVFTRYTFDGGPLDGMFVGGGYRYQSKAPVNFDEEEVLHYGNSRGVADFLLGYRLPEMRFLGSPTIQLNVNNLFNNDDPRISRYDAENPTEISRVSLMEPRSWRITMRFEF